MRIIAGRFGGRRIAAPPGQDVRPTSDKVRGAVFNILVSLGGVEGRVVLDGFCGSGALGLEALSRGATHCTFVDLSRRSLDVVQENARLLGAMDHSRFVMCDMTRFDPGREQASKYDLVFLDPPYRKNLIAPVLQRLAEGGMLAEDAVVVAECARGETVHGYGSFAVHDTRQYGETSVSFLYRA